MTVSNELGGYEPARVTKPRKVRQVFPKAHYMCAVPDSATYGSFLYVAMIRDKAGWVLCKYRGAYTRPTKVGRDANGDETYMVDLLLEGSASVSSEMVKTVVNACIIRHGRVVPENITNTIFLMVKGKIHA